jgi:hypothetical protein
LNTESEGPPAQRMSARLQECSFLLSQGCGGSSGGLGGGSPYSKARFAASFL